MISKTKEIRCAIYTRKSTDEGLEREFNTLDAQREAAEAYITSQREAGWVCLSERYDDGGFSGGTLERPAMQRLREDIAAGKVDCVVVYKVDRLSRSLLDFTTIIADFDQHGVSFVSVTQQFNTTTSMGRLTLNILLSFAQFEREIIGERIRDKIAAQRRRGKWTGGKPVLGYDVDRSTGNPRLVVNEPEADQVRQIFNLYLQLGSLMPVVRELDRRGWRTKVTETKAGRIRGGAEFDRCSLHSLLKNSIYIGKIRHRENTYEGEHVGIVDADVFDRVQKQLAENGKAHTRRPRRRGGALLRGVLRCKACDTAMAHTFSSRGSKRYRYYACSNAIKRGRSSCPAPYLPAAELEKLVIAEVRSIADSKLLQSLILKFANEQLEVDGADEKLSHWDVKRSIKEFDELWSHLAAEEQALVVELLTEQIVYDAEAESISIQFQDEVAETLNQAGGVA